MWSSGWLLIATVLAGAMIMACAEAAAPRPAGAAVAIPSSDAGSADAVRAEAESEYRTVADLFPEGPGRALVLDTCGACHAVACSAIGQRTLARWDNLHADHRDKASGTSEEDLTTVFTYLKASFSEDQPELRVPPRFLEAGCTPF